MPPKPPVRRNLFGTLDKEKTSEWLAEQEKAYLEEKTAKWGFDFRVDRPLNEPPLSSELESIEAVEPNLVPYFYRPRAVPNKSTDKPTKKRKIQIDEEASEKSPATSTPSQEAILERPVEIGFVSPTKKSRRANPKLELREDTIQRKLSGDYVQVYKKKSNAHQSLVETKVLGAGDVKFESRAKRAASGSQTSTDHPSTSSAADDSELGEMRHSGGKLVTSMASSVRSRIRSIFHRL